MSLLTSFMMSHNALQRLSWSTSKFGGSLSGCRKKRTLRSDLMIPLWFVTAVGRIGEWRAKYG